jgi:hypothetical protein
MQFVKRFFGAILALVILFEEWGWVPLQRLMVHLARLPPLAWLERRIAALPPYAALVVFFLPALTLLPVKLLALWLLGQGQRMLGLLLIVLAKVVGTALVARLFTLTQPALMRLPWFAQSYGRWSAWKEMLLARVRASCAGVPPIEPLAGAQAPGPARPRAYQNCQLPVCTTHRPSARFVTAWAITATHRRPVPMYSSA